MVMRYHQEKQQKEVKAEKEEANKIKRIARTMAKMVEEFWGNIEKVCILQQICAEVGERMFGTTSLFVAPVTFAWKFSSNGMKA